MLNYGYQCLKSVQNYGYHLKKSAELWAPFLVYVAKRWLFLEKCSLLCGVMGMVFIIFVELWVAFSNMDGVMGPGIKSKWHTPIQS